MQVMRKCCPDICLREGTEGFFPVLPSLCVSAPSSTHAPNIFTLFSVQEEQGKMSE